MASKGDIHLEEASGLTARPQPGQGVAATPSAEPLIPKAGQWIFITGWQGPTLLVLSAKKVAVCQDHGRRARIEFRDILAIGETQDDVKRAASAFSRVQTDRRAELDAAQDAVREANNRRNDIQRDIRAQAIAAAREAIVKVSAQ